MGELPPSRVLLVQDNPAGRKTRAFVPWVFAHGVMPVYTPHHASWLYPAGSAQRLFRERERDG